jgi:hypothetical protein
VRDDMKREEVDDVKQGLEPIVFTFLAAPKGIM